MEYHVFLHEVEINVKKKVATGQKVVMNTVIKNNDQKLDAISIIEDNRSFVPNVYVNRYYKEYLQGVKSMDEIVNEIIQMNETNDCPNDYVSDIDDFNMISKRLIYRLVNLTLNSERLKGVPFKSVGDLATVYHVVAHMDTDGVASFYVSNDMLNRWGVSIDTIDKLATDNTRKLFPEILRSMTDLIQEMIFGVDGDSNNKDKHLFADMGGDDDIKMYVLSNKSGINGASAILYKDVLKDFALQMKSNLYILPSSIHEVIIVPAIKKLKLSNLREMVVDVNKNEVPLSEVLSNEVYYYNLEREEMHIAVE